MKRYIYMIEVQKPTGAHRFLKSFSEPIVVEKEVIDKDNSFRTVIYYDRIENFTYIKTISATDENDLLDIYYGLVKEYKESLQYTKDNYVYLIPKRPKNKGVPIGHKLPRLPRYPRVSPIPFYPEKKMEEYDYIPDSKSIEPTKKYKDFCTEKWFKKFLETLNELLWFNCCHSYEYLVFEAFVLTYGKYYAENEKTDITETLYYHYKLNDTPCALDRLGIEWISTFNIPSYEYYIKPTLEGIAFSLPNGYFYSVLDPAGLYECYFQFSRALEKWRTK